MSGSIDILLASWRANDKRRTETATANVGGGRPRYRPVATVEKLEPERLFASVDDLGVAFAKLHLRKGRSPF